MENLTVSTYDPPRICPWLWNMPSSLFPWKTCGTRHLISNPLDNGRGNDTKSIPKWIILEDFVLQGNCLGQAEISVKRVLQCRPDPTTSKTSPLWIKKPAYVGFKRPSRLSHKFLISSCSVHVGSLGLPSKGHDGGSKVTHRQHNRSDWKLETLLCRTVTALTTCESFPDHVFAATHLN